MRKVKTGPQVLVWKGKHGDVYWDASGENELGAFLAMFETLDQNESYYELDEGWKDTQEYIADIARELGELRTHLATLPESLRLVAQGKILAKEREISEHTSVERQRELYLRAKAGDGHAASCLIRERSDWEYERYSLEELNPPAKVSVKST